MDRVSTWVAVAACITLGASPGCEDDDAGGLRADVHDVVDAGALTVIDAAVAPAAEARDAGASDAPAQSVTITFKAKVGDEDLACGKWYAGLGTSKVGATVQDFRMFVEDIRLVREDASEARVQLDSLPPFQTSEVALLDFTDREGRCVSAGPVVNSKVTGRVAPGAYVGIVFVNGVPEARNHLNIAEAKPPLQDTTTYWGWRGGYRFIMCELFIDAAANEISDAGMDDPTSKLVHFGSGGCSQTPPNYVCTRPNRTRIALRGFDPSKNVIVADLGKVFENIDLRKENVDCHGPDPVCRPAYDAFGIGIDDGLVRDGQTVFRVE